MKLNYLDSSLVAILRGITPKESIAHADILYSAGFRAIEVPLNSPKALTSIRQLCQHFQAKADSCVIGAGTVTDSKEVEDLATTGAKLIVTPNTDVTVINKAKALGFYVIAGFMTTSEAFAAIKAGADALKLFPAHVLGVAYVKALKSILPPMIPIWAVGGMQVDNIKKFLAAGCSGVGLGTSLYRAGQTIKQTQDRAHAFVHLLR